jgi:CheY-like chemotaxis protein
LNRAPVILIDDNVELASLLGTLIAEQGLLPVVAHTAEEGAKALAAYPRAVAIVLDLLLPDLTGQKLLARLVHEHQTLPPVLIMTGVFSGAAHQEKVRSICEIAGWYEKPFDARLLVEGLAAIAGIDPKSRTEHLRLKGGEDAFDDFEIVEGTPVSSVDDSDAHRVIGTGDLEETTVADDDEDFNDFPTVIEAVPRLRFGDLSRTTLPSLLFAVYAAQETAEVVFERNGRRRMIYFSRGCPVYASSDDPEMRDTRAIVQSLFAWTSGRYMVGFKVDTHLSGLSGEPLHPAALVLEGVRDAFELERLRALVPSALRPMPAPSSPFPLQDLPLTDREASILLRATGARSVEAIVREMQAKASERETLAVLYSLLALGVLVDVRALP